ncbi:MAG: hypothetical protein ACWGPS_10155 [Candidatus Promineifilaceae bacterium]
MSEAQFEFDWKKKTLVVGTALGAALGLMTGWLLTRQAEETGNTPPEIKTSDAIKVLIGVVGLVRGVASLGSRD